MSSRSIPMVKIFAWTLVVLGAGLLVWGQTVRLPQPSTVVVTSTPPAPPTWTATATPTRTPEPLIPTAPPVRTATPEATPTESPTATSTTIALSPTMTPDVSSATPTSTWTPSPEPTAAPVVPADRSRVGVSVATGSPVDYDLAALGVGWVMNWHAYAAPPAPAGVQFAQTVRLQGGVLHPDAEMLMAIAAAQPGALWLISNEPDVRWQDNVTPETYARLYHEAYSAIRAGDAGANVAPGGIAQPTPLRLAYLDRVRAAYESAFGESLPVQAWHIHNYMLREERNSWGVDIPPGFADDTGVLYAIDDSGNLEAFKAQLYAFRQWMAERGYRDLPLIISEFGVPMPEEYGFPPERMARYLQETWRFLATATDGGIGNPTDGGRLVQRWCWFSLADPVYATGNLIDLETGAWTPLGRTWLALVRTR